MALAIIPSDLGTAAKAFVDLKLGLDKEKAARITTQIEINVLAQAVKDLKIFADRFATRIPTLEDSNPHS
jgi:hypothetical protein